MKKIIGIIILFGIILGGYFKYNSYIKKVKNSVQGSPESTVEEFLKICEKWSNLLWKENEKEKIIGLMKEMSKVKEERDKEKLNQIKEQILSLGLVDPSYLFKKGNYGMVALNTFALHEFGWYKLNEAKPIEKNKAEVYVEFCPKDFIGLGSLIQSFTGKEQRIEPQKIPFYLQKRRYKWYIVDIGGQIGNLINASYRLKKYK